MRIVSLLPSATEIVFALGLGDELEGVTHECDWPPAARSKRVVSFSRLPSEADPAVIDQLVSQSVGSSEPIYGIDAAALAQINPDLIVTQDLCAVCAVPSGHVHEALDQLGCSATVCSLDPNSLDDVIDTVLEVGSLAGAPERAQEIVTQLRHRLAAVRSAVAGRDRVPTFALEWPDPPFNGGHWVPDMITAAGGEPVLASPHSPSVRVDWSAIAAAEAQVVVFMPCGFDLDGALGVAQGLVNRPELESVKGIVVVDANAFFSRPGPRLIDGVELLAGVLHPGSVPEPDGAAYRWL